MVDPETDINSHRGSLKFEDIRTFSSDCPCATCERRRAKGEKRVTPLFEDYKSIHLSQDGELTDHAYLLCPVVMRAFVFKTRLWGKGAHR